MVVEGEVAGGDLLDAGLPLLPPALGAEEAGLFEELMLTDATGPECLGGALELAVGADAWLAECCGPGHIVPPR
jgi:hypothetical protein